MRIGEPESASERSFAIEVSLATFSPGPSSHSKVSTTGPFKTLMICPWILNCPNLSWIFEMISKKYLSSSWEKPVSGFLCEEILTKSKYASSLIDSDRRCFALKVEISDSSTYSSSSASLLKLISVTSYSSSANGITNFWVSVRSGNNIALASLFELISLDSIFFFWRLSWGSSLLSLPKCSISKESLESLESLEFFENLFFNSSHFSRAACVDSW